MDAPTENLIRNVPFEVTRSIEDGDGLTLEGYAAVFDSPTEINSWEGRFIERIKRGAFTKTLSERMPVLMFNHGQHPLIGDMPIGVIQHAREDERGLFIRARLATNWLIEPVREAISQRAVDGMSFRFSVPQGKEVWRRVKDQLPERDVTELRCPELGPVVFPAYIDTTVDVRSVLALTEADQIAEALDTIRAADKTPYGNVTYADPGYQTDKKKRYPLDTKAHAKAAWSYINMDKNASQYSSDDLARIKSRIKSALKKFGVDTSENSADPDGNLRQDADENPVLLAQAVDAVLDSMQEAVDAGDLAQMADLLTAAEVSIDELIELLGGIDADDQDTPDSGATPTGTPMMGAGMNMNSNEPPPVEHSVDQQAIRRQRARKVLAHYQGVL